MEIKKHWLTHVEHCRSPNCDQRPLDEDISLLVIHNISLPPGEFGKKLVPLFFQNKLPKTSCSFLQEISCLKVSAHLFIDRHGIVTQFVAFNQRAWHAGVSMWRGKSHCNDFSIGIELEGTDVIPYTKQQYQQLILITHLLFQSYPKLCPDNIVGHEHIAPERKTDPGPSFDWQYYRQALMKKAI